MDVLSLINVVAVKRSWPMSLLKILSVQVFIHVLSESKVKHSSWDRC